MTKKFKEWGTQKELTEKKEISTQFKKREVFWTRVGENIGFEQCGKGEDFLRPVLIFRRFNSKVFWGIPLSKTNKSGLFYFKLLLKDQKSVAILSQLRLFDSKRLERKIGMISKENFLDLEKAIQKLMNDF